MWGCINGWYRLAYQNQNNAYVSAVHQLFCATRISTNQSDEDWHDAPDSCTLEVFHTNVCAQNVNLPISIRLYSTKITFENEIDTGIYEWE